MFSRDELKQYEMAQEFPVVAGGPIRFFIGDGDAARLTRYEALIMLSMQQR